MKRLDPVFRDSVSWLGAGGVYNCGWDEDDLRRSVQQAHMIAVDPGAPCGVACFGWDLAAYGISLHQCMPEDLAYTIIKSFPTGIDLDIVCETPLKGAVRVFDEHPWKVRGFLELWHTTVHDGESQFIPAPVAWLKPGTAFVTFNDREINASNKDTKDALAALRYGVMAVVNNEKLRERLEPGEFV